MSYTREQITESMEQWEALAAEQDERATWTSTHRTGCVDVCRNKAALYRRTVEALRLELETGQPHCTCCLKPANLFDKHGRSR